VSDKGRRVTAGDGALLDSTFRPRVWSRHKSAWIDHGSRVNLAALSPASQNSAAIVVCAGNSIQLGAGWRSTGGALTLVVSPHDLLRSGLLGIDRRSMSGTSDYFVDRSLKSARKVERYVYLGVDPRPPSAMARRGAPEVGALDAVRTAPGAQPALHVHRPTR
jgi:hypothetical protein